jgi:hypothetical protein
MADEVADGVAREFKEAVDRQLLARIAALEAELAIAKAKLGPRGDTLDASVQTDPPVEEQVLVDGRGSRIGTGLLQRMFPGDAANAPSRFPVREASKTVSEPPRSLITEPPHQPQRLKPRVWAYDENGTFKVMEGDDPSPKRNGRP